MNDFKIDIIKDNYTKPEKNIAIHNNANLFIKCFSNGSRKLIGELIGYYPLTERKLKTFQNFTLSEKRGFISRYIMGCANKAGIPDIYIKDFLSLKYRLRVEKYKMSENRTLLKTRVFKEELKLLNATLQLTRKTSIRKRKLDEIFFK